MSSFKNALRGIAAAYRRERNLRIHSAAAYFVTAAGVICGISRAEWVAVIICIGLVISAELINTAVESACDAQTLERRPEIKLAKDAAAGAVLVLAIAAATVGLIIFTRDESLSRGIGSFREHPWLWAAAAVSLAFFIKIIFFTWRDRDGR